MKVNFLLLLLTSLIPLVIGFIWYNQKVFGNVWMRESGMTMEKAQSSNMAKTFGLTYLMSFFIAFSLQFLVIHQWSFFSILANEPGISDPNSPIGTYIADFMAKYGHNFRTFKHGAFHAFLDGIFIVLPLITVPALFERKSAKYIFIHAGYWTVCMMLMGGVICQWS